MKKTLVVLTAFAALVATMSCGGAGKFKSDVDSLSYAIGADMGLNAKFSVKDLELDNAIILESMKDFIENGDLESEEFKKEMMDMQKFQYTKFMPYMQAKMQQNDSTQVELPSLYDEEFTREKIASYIGHSMGADAISLKTNSSINMPFFSEGMEDAFDVEDFENIEKINGNLRITLEEMQQVFDSYQKKEMAKLYNENKEASAKWLAEVEKMEGVMKTESGILYRIDREGKGKKATNDTDVVKVNYEGKLRTGEVFDSSYQRGEAISFPLNGVIKGWTEGMKLVGVGGQITLWIPSELAYGERGAGQDIAPGEALEFKVELLEVNKAKAEKKEEKKTEKKAEAKAEKKSEPKAEEKAEKKSEPKAEDKAEAKAEDKE